MGQIKRSAGQSAIAAAAYRAGERLYSDYYGEFSDYTNKGGVVHAEILLPPHAPKEYADRQTLWNAVEKAEPHPKAQLAYSFDIALQNELSLEENIALARHFLLEEFVSRGMMVDFAVHMPDPKEGGIPNPHFHVMCPVRPLKEDGTWDAKQHRVYELDEGGNRIRDGNGDYVFNAVPTTDWGSPETLEHWRQAWSDLCNTKFQEKHLPERIDNRSFVRQGLDTIPTVHEGPAVRQMEARGIRTNKGDLNRWIKATNDLLRRIKKRIAELLDLLTESKAEKTECVLQFLNQYYENRNAGAYSNKAKSSNLKQQAADLIYLEERNIVTMEQFEEYFSQVRRQVNGIRDAQNARAARMKELKNLIQLAADFARLKPIVDAIPPKGGWGKKHEKYMTEHDSEVRQFYAVKRKLDSCNLPDKKLTPNAWQSERDQLSEEYVAQSEKLKPINADLKRLWDIQYKVNTAQHDCAKEKRSVMREQILSS